MKLGLAIRCAALLAVIAFTATASAISLGFSDRVGTVRSGEPAGSSDETGYVDFLLSMPVNPAVFLFHDSHFYNKINPPFIPSGTVGVGVQDTSGNSGSGVGWLLAKYDGPNGGDVLWAINGAFTIPLTSAGLFSNTAGQPFDLSHFTIFSTQIRVPDNGMTIALVGIGLVALGVMRWKKVK